MEWRVGVLRAGVENIDWTAYGEEPDWLSARKVALTTLRELVVREGRQEYRVQVDDMEGIARPGIADGELDLSNINSVIPAERWLVW